MSKKSYERHSVDILCPFFVGKDTSRIVCEGLLPGSTTGLSFSNPAVYADWVNKKCKANYNSCAIADMLNRKWNEKTEQRH